MPLSWVPPLVLTRERLDLRCPQGTKAVQYRQARREMFAAFGEASRWVRRQLTPRHADSSLQGCPARPAAPTECPPLATRRTARWSG